MKNKIIVLTISDLFYEANLNRKVKTLQQNGCEVTLFAAYHPDLDLSAWQGIRLHQVQLKSKITALRFFEFWLKAFFWILKQQADLFIAYDYVPLLPLRLRAMLKPTIYIYDSVELLSGLNALVNRPRRRRFWLWVEKFSLQKAKAAFTVCESDARVLQEQYPNLNVAGVVRNIPEPQEYRVPTELKKQLGVESDQKIGVYQGMLFEGRGLEKIIEACSSIEQVFLLIVGDGPLKERLQNRVNSLGMERRVRFTGMVPFQELAKFTAVADFGFTIIDGVGLSYYHALPNKLFEYIQARIPVIGSNYPEIKKIVDSEGIGITVDPNSVQEIRNAVQTLLQPQHYEKFKKRLDKIAGKYTWRKESEAYLRIVRIGLEE